MIDRASMHMAEGNLIGCERIQGINDNMSQSHYHTHYELYFLEQGERFHMLNGEIYETKPGDFMIFAPYVMHHSYSDKDVSFKRIVLYFNEAAILSDELCKKMKEASGLYHTDSKVSHIIHNLLCDLLEEENANELYSNEAKEALLLQLLVTVERSAKKSAPPEMKNRISRVIEYIENNYTREIRLETLASEFFTSEYYLCHEFKKYTNKTIIQYINAIRIMHAQLLIMESKLRFTDIAEKCGFSSLTHFNRTFKNVTGLSPSEYKKKYVQNLPGPRHKNTDPHPSDFGSNF